MAMNTRFFSARTSVALALAAAILITWTGRRTGIGGEK